MTVNSDLVKPIAQLLDLALRIPTQELLFAIVFFITHTADMLLHVIKKEHPCGNCIPICSRAPAQTPWLQKHQLLLYKAT
jgi:hypothetical protein